MKKILILIVMVFGLVACGEKFPYTSKSNKEKMLKEFEVAAEKAEKTNDEKDIQVAFEKYLLKEEIIIHSAADIDALLSPTNMILLMRSFAISYQKQFQN